MNPKEMGRLRRHARIRKKVNGTLERPRLAVRRSHLHLYAQIIDDASGKTLVFCSTRDEDFKKRCPKGGDIEAAKQLGQWVGERAKTAGIQKLVFDRGGYVYHGRVQALAESLRSQGVSV